MVFFPPFPPRKPLEEFFLHAAAEAEEAAEEGLVAEADRDEVVEEGAKRRDAKKLFPRVDEAEEEEGLARATSASIEMY